MYYTKISNDLLRGKFKANTKILLLVLISYENEKGYAYPSHKRLLEETGLSKNTLLKCMDELVEKGYIAKEKGEGTNNKYFINSSLKIDTATSVKNDTALDGTSIKNDTGVVLKLIHENKQKNNNNKKEKEKSNFDKIIEAYTQNDELVEVIKDFIKMRKTIKKPLTDRALKTILSKLDLFEKEDIYKIQILENSIENCWQGVFELKNKKAPVGAGTESNKKYNYNHSICNTTRNNTPKIEGTKFI